jgi:endoglycosylceramidase
MKRWLPMMVSLMAAGCSPADVPLLDGPGVVEIGPDGVEMPAHHWLDAEGRTVLHRGVNVNSHAKGDEFHDPGLTDAEWTLLVDAGFSFVRLLVFWEGVEPEEGVWDVEYLARLDERLDELDALGVDVMLDMHQDLWGEGFGSHGAPYWSCDPVNYEEYSPAGNYWWEGYLTDQVANCFNGLWESEELQGHVAESWARLAAVARDHPSVVGYEVLNEPFFGRFEQDEMDEVILPAFYERVIDAIRAVDPCGADGSCRFVALEPSLHTNLLWTTSLVFPDREALVFAPHFYPAYAEIGSGWDGTFDNEAAALGELMGHAEDSGVPFLLGEYGIFSSVGNEHVFVQSVIDEVEATGGATAYWSYDHGGDHMLLTPDGEPGWMMGAFHRPYLHRIPGRVVSVEGFADGVEVVYEPTVDAPAVAIVPVEVGEANVTGATVSERDGVRWTLAPDAPVAGRVVLRIEAD